MSKRFLWLIGALLMGLTVLSACATAKAASEEDEHMDEHSDEHVDDEHMDDEHMDGDHMHVDPPAEYADLENPFAGSHEAAEAGEELFATNCTPCHGETGAGDGPLAVGLDPQPADLADPQMMADMTDAYMFWRISEGGGLPPFSSAMPTWKAQLDEDQRWQLVTFVRELGEHGH